MRRLNRRLDDCATGIQLLYLLNNTRLDEESRHRIQAIPVQAMKVIAPHAVVSHVIDMPNKTTDAPFGANLKTIQKQAGRTYGIKMMFSNPIE